MATTTLFFGDSPKAPKANDFKASGDTAIDALLARNPALWRGCDIAGRGDHGQPTGYPQLDAILPGRGWPRNAVVEIVTPQWGMGELQLLVPLMRQVVAEHKWILWISPPYLLNSPALLQAGIDPGQVLVINLEISCKDALWSMEKALQAAGCGLVLAWQNWLPDKVVRRLQLAAETGETLGVLFQHRASKYSQPSLRLKLEEPSPADRPAGGRNRVPTPPTEVSVLRARGSFRPRSVQLNLYQESLPFALSAGLDCHEKA
ncbi:MAG: translesion DNA synthesis-associated protein ImuA [Pseudomonadales bacterium]|nr:translesion DNA synthesis-associated protein ImuA [Pseudomonadales bacterium]